MFDFKHQMITTLRNQVHQWTGEGSNEYSLAKANDAITFLDILSTKFDVAVANPPYTDSADFGVELKEFVGTNYSKPLKFNSNLYACFIKRCCELAGDDGKVGMINPPTFMYIKTFEDVRKYIVEKTYISLFVEWGYLGLFSQSARVDSAIFILDKSVRQEESTFIKLNDLYEMKRKEVLFDAYYDFCNGRQNARVYQLPQSKLKDIKSYPFIYWISDEFREKFGDKLLDDVVDVKQGIATSNNNRFLRYWWEITGSNQSYYPYSKGGEYAKWAGNLWIYINWEEKNVEYIKVKGRLQNRNYYFREGITYSGSGSKGTSFRIFPKDCLFDVGGSCIFLTDIYSNRYYLLAFLNSKICFYIAECLNPTVNTQVGDLQRVPFIIPSKGIEELVSALSEQNISIKHYIDSCFIIDKNFRSSPIGYTKDINSELFSFYVSSNGYLSISLLNEAIINGKIFDVYELSVHDRQMVIDKEGLPVGDYSVSSQAKAAYKEWLSTNTEFPASQEVLEHIDSLEINEDQPHIDDFESLYQNNNGWEEFCIKHKMNPIEVWYQFRNAGILPPQRTQVLAFELVTDVIRSVLAKDDDGVIPLTERMGEEQLAGRIEQELVERGYNSAQISQIIQLLGTPLDKYLQDKFFKQLSDHLNLFMYLPKSPFIWHLTSGTHHAIELYISIYKWSRDTVFRIKSVYIANRETALNDRLSGVDISTANGQLEAAELKEQLKELKAFAEKIDKLLASGYDPKLDDGVGKNIAPLQKAGLLSYEVLNAGQLKKYLNADW